MINNGNLNDPDDKVVPALYSIKRREELSRFPQDLNFSPELLDKIFGEDAPIIRDIAVLASYRYNKNLFDYTELTIDDFEKLGYNRTDLQRVNPKFAHLSKADIKKLVEERKELLKNNPYSINTIQEEEYPFIHDHLCISRLDYAFYKAYRTIFEVTRKNQNSIAATKLEIIGDLLIQSPNQMTKRKYVFQLSHRWVEKLFKAYNLLNIEDYLLLGMDTKIDRAGSLKNFYLHLGRMIASAQQLKKQNKQPVYVTSVDEICRIAGSKIASPDNKKKFVSNFLDELTSKVKRTKFEWKYFAPQGTRAKYMVEFSFAEELLLFFDEGKRATLMKALLNEAQLQYKSKELKEDLNKLGTLTEEDFFYWFVSDEDQELKKKILSHVANKTLTEVTLPDAVGKRPVKRNYVDSKTLIDLAKAKNIKPEEFAKQNGYLIDEKGKYYKLA
jgi:hypothetical protein